SFHKHSALPLGSIQNDFSGERTFTNVGTPFCLYSNARHSPFDTTPISAAISTGIFRTTSSHSECLRESCNLASMPFTFIVKPGLKPRAVEAREADTSAIHFHSQTGLLSVVFLSIG